MEARALIALAFANGGARGIEMILLASRDRAVGAAAPPSFFRSA